MDEKKNAYTILELQPGPEVDEAAIKKVCEAIMGLQGSGLVQGGRLTQRGLGLGGRSTRDRVGCGGPAMCLPFCCPLFVGVPQACHTKASRQEPRQPECRYGVGAVNGLRGEGGGIWHAAMASNVSGVAAVGALNGWKMPCISAPTTSYPRSCNAAAAARRRPVLL